MRIRTEGNPSWHKIGSLGIVIYIIIKVQVDSLQIHEILFYEPLF